MAIGTYFWLLEIDHKTDFDKLIKSFKEGEKITGISLSSFNTPQEEPQ